MYSNTEDKRLLNLLSIIPPWYLFYIAYKTAMIPSKVPELFYIYSYNKVIALFLILTSIFIYNRFLFKNIFNILDSLNNKLKFTQRNPYIIFFIIYLFFSIFSLSKGLKVGEDISTQVLSSKHFLEDKVNYPNLILSPKISDLSDNTIHWHGRPPAASWVALPFMSAGFSLGYSIKIFLFIIGILSGIGWLKLCKRLGILSHGTLFISILISLSLSLSLNYLGTLSIILFCITPWMIIFSLNISDNFYRYNNFRIILIVTSFYIFLGCFCLIKTSGMICAFTISIIPASLLFFKKENIQHFFLKVSFLILLFPIILLPFYILSKYSESINGVSPNKMYETTNYDLQNELWGKHFMGSTQGFQSILSTVSAPGYALPAKKLIHSFRDFLVQFNLFSNSFDKKMLNSHTFIASIFGMIFLSLILYITLKEHYLISSEAKIILLIFYTIPFIGLGIVSYFHRFNYSLYHTHTFEYSIILSFPIIIIWQSIKNFKFLVKIAIFICMLLPLFNSFDTINFNFERKFQSSTDVNNGLSSHRFSIAIDRIEEDSVNELDILYFLPSGGASDLKLRTKLMSIVTHFAKDNVTASPIVSSSKPLNVYCAYDAILNTNENFKNKMNLKFSNAKKEIFYSGNIIVDKFSFNL